MGHSILDNISDKDEGPDILNELIINFGQTGLTFVPVSNWTLAPEGSNGLHS